MLHAGTQSLYTTNLCAHRTCSSFGCSWSSQKSKDACDACRIPLPYLGNTKKFLAPELPEAPLIVFINSKSGGHAGPELTEVLYHTLGHAQVRSRDLHHLGCSFCRKSSSLSPLRTYLRALGHLWITAASEC